MLHPLEMAIFQNLRQLFAPMPQESQLLLLCVSGGRDSMCLLRALHALRHSPLAARLPILNLHAVHFNHERRGLQSDLDASFVAAECTQLSVPVHIERLSETGPGTDQVTGANFQQMASAWRLSRAQHLTRELSMAASENGASSWVVTAHHARDHLESVLLHLARGCGARGLLGIRSVDTSRRLLRPLAETPFLEIDRYQKERRVSFREDASNNTDDYDRNLVRHKVVPHLQELNPSVEAAFVRMSRNLDSIVERRTPSEFETILDIAEAHCPSLARQLSRNSLANLAHHLRLHKLRPNRPLHIPVGDGWTAVAADGTLRFERVPFPQAD